MRAPGATSGWLEFAVGAEGPHYGGDVVPLYAYVTISAGQEMSEGAHALIKLPKDKFTRPVLSDIDQGDSIIKGAKITETSTDYVLEISYAKFSSGYTGGTPVRVSLLKYQTINQSNNDIKYEFYDPNNNKVSDMTLKVQGKADMEYVRGYTWGAENIIDKVDGTNHIKPNTIVGLSPYSLSTSEKTDPRDRRITVTLPDGINLKASTGWTNVPGTNDWYKDVKRNEISYANYQVSLDLSGIDMSPYTSSSNTKNIKLSLKSEIIENGVVQKDLNPVTWEFTKRYYIQKVVEPDAYHSIGTGRWIRFVGKDDKPIQNSTYSYNPTVFLPYGSERLDNYRIDIRHQAISYFSINYPKDDQANNELVIQKTTTPIHEYSYPSEIAINLRDSSLSQQEKDLFAAKFQGTKAYGIKADGSRVLLTDKVPIGHADQLTYYKFDGKDYRSIEFEYPNGGITLKGKAEIDKYKSILNTQVICDFKPEVIDKLQELMDQGKPPTVSGAYRYSYTSGTIKYLKKQGGELSSVNFTSSDYTIPYYNWQYDAISRSSQLTVMDGKSKFFVNEAIKTYLTYRHRRNGNFAEAQNPENLRIYYLVPDGLEVKKSADDFESIEVIRGYKEGYNLVVAKPKKMNIPTGTYSYSDAYNTYHLDFYPSSRLKGETPYKIMACLCIDNNKLEEKEGKPSGILQYDTPSGLWAGITEEAKNHSPLKDKFTDFLSVPFSIYPPQVLTAYKSVKLNSEGDAMYSSSIGTKGKVGKKIDYRWTIKNTSKMDVTKLTIIDVLPFKGDQAIVPDIDGNYPARESKFKTPLLSVDQAEKFDIFYSTEPPSKTAQENMNAHWEATAADPSKVTMIMAVLKEGQKITKGDELYIVTHNMIENDPLIEDGEKAFNTFAFSINGGAFSETLPTEVPVTFSKRNLELTKIYGWDPSVKLAGVKFDLYMKRRSGDELIQKDLETNEEGMIQLKDLLVGKSYYLIETQTVPGYYLSKSTSKFPFTISEEGKEAYKLIAKNYKKLRYPDPNPSDEPPGDQKLIEEKAGGSDEFRRKNHLPQIGSKPFYGPFFPVPVKAPERENPANPKAVNPPTGAR